MLLFPPLFILCLVSRCLYDRFLSKALVTPGEAALHEGSEVVKGVKYVIRTEVLFPLTNGAGVNSATNNSLPTRESRQGGGARQL